MPGFDGLVGTLERGKQADLVILDLEAMSEPCTCDGGEPLDPLLYRGAARHVRTVLVAGEVLDRGTPTRLDRNELIRTLREAVPPDYERRFREADAPMAALRAAIAAHFRPRHEEIARREARPYYRMNNRL